MANISKDTGPNAISKGYDKVIFLQQGAILDSDFNESQDIARDWRDRLVSQMAEGLSLLGSAGQVKPPVSSTARSVDVVGGILLSGGKVVRLPAVTNLRVFNDTTTTGTASSVVYAEWSDSEVDYTTDVNLKPTNTLLGNGHARVKRTVNVLAVIGSTVIPAPAAGVTQVKLATVTHNFTSNGAVVLTSDVVQEPYGPTAGELGGYGAARTLRLVSNAPANGVAQEQDTRTAFTGGKLLSLKNAGVEKAFLDYAGALTLLGGLTATTGTFSSNVGVTGNLTVSGLVDGVDVSAHVHDGTATGGVKVSHANLLGLTSADDHTQYMHNTTGRTVTARHTFNPSTAASPFILGANALNQLVAGLNADLLDGKDLTDLAQLAAVQTILASWTFNANVLAAAGVTFDGVDLSTVKDGGAGIDHAKLTGLTGTDHHTQYLHLTTARTVTAVHTFNPAAAGAPFALGANAAGQLVTGLNAEKVGGQSLTNLDARFVKVDGTVPMTAALTIAQGGQTLNLREAGTNTHGYLAWLDSGAARKGFMGFASNGDTAITLKNEVLNGHLLLATSGTGEVRANTAFRAAARARFDANFLNGAVSSNVISASGSVVVANVGARALVTNFVVDPNTYTGSYDVYVYSDSTTTSLLAKWQGQTGVMQDRVPWFFKNDRTDEALYVQIVKATTGTAHTFAVTLSAERFA